MKIKYAVAASLLLSMSAFAQKEELKAIKKLDGKEKLTADENKEYKRLLVEVEPKMGAATDEQKAEFHYYKGSFANVEMLENPALAVTNFPIAVENLKTVLELEKKTGKKKYTEEIETYHFPAIKQGALMFAQALSDKKQYKEAAKYYEAAYQVDTKDQSQLYNAAAMAVNGQDYDNALKYYTDLDKSGFTGEGTAFTAKNKATGQIEGFPNKATRDIAVKGGQYVEPKDEKLPSLKGEITKNIALIYVQKGENDKAKQAMSAARKNNPDDVNLIVAEANIYYQAKDMDGYKRLINEAAAKNPNNPELFYNLGVVAAETDKAEGERQYTKALTIDPNYEPALVAMATIILADEQKIVEEMNGLGTSKKDNERYDALKKKKDGLYSRSITYLEKAHKLKPDNQYTISLLAGIYQALERDADYKAMKAKMK